MTTVIAAWCLVVVFYGDKPTVVIPQATKSLCEENVRTLESAKLTFQSRKMFCLPTGYGRGGE